jgi:hypothetical protein
VEKLIEYTNNVDISDIQTEISKIHNDILNHQSEAGDTERIIHHWDNIAGEIEISKLKINEENLFEIV